MDFINQRPKLGWWFEKETGIQGWQKIDLIILELSPGPRPSRAMAIWLSKNSLSTPALYKLTPIPFENTQTSTCRDYREIGLTCNACITKFSQFAQKPCMTPGMAELYSNQKSNITNQGTIAAQSCFMESSHADSFFNVWLRLPENQVPRWKSGWGRYAASSRKPWCLFFETSPMPLVLSITACTVLFCSSISAFLVSWSLRFTWCFFFFFGNFHLLPFYVGVVIFVFVF